MSRGLYFTKTVDESLVVLVTVFPVVHSPVTVWTKCNHPSRMIRTSIGDPADVVSLQVGTSLRGDERRLLSTSLTGALCPPFDVDLNGL